MENDPNSFSREIPKIEKSPRGEGLLEKPLEPEVISRIPSVTITIRIFKDINVEFYTVEGELIQGLKIPVNLLLKIQNYDNIGIRSKIKNRLFKTSQYGELVQKGGIYIFCNSKTHSIKRKIYVGESNELLTRLKNHKKTKEGSFSSILIITSVGDDIGKDKLKVIESMLISSLKEHHIFEVINKQKKTKFQVDFFDESLVNKHYETILDLIEWSC